MDESISKKDARKLWRKLCNSPIAPGREAWIINVGTNPILDSLEKNYFCGDLADGLGTFKYLEGDYGSGKTQFIHSLARLATQQNIVTALVTVGEECPFNSPLAIYKGIMQSFRTPYDEESEFSEAKGIEILIESWIRKRIRELGEDPEGDVSARTARDLEKSIGRPMRGMPDMQMATGLPLLGRSILSQVCGASQKVIDPQLVSWIRGEHVKSKPLREIGLFEPAGDTTAFRRLKTVIAYLRTRMDYRGFLIAFDEGTRVTSFRRGSRNQKQAIENLLSMINQNAEGEFGGVMFLYAATPDFRQEVITNYRALMDRIGTKVWSPASPLVPLIVLEEANSMEVLREIGERLLAVSGRALDIEWEEALQRENMRTLLEAQEQALFETPRPRYFVYQYCIFLSGQAEEQRAITEEEAREHVGGNEAPDTEEEITFE